MRIESIPELAQFASQKCKDYDLDQSELAAKLGVKQPAVSAALKSTSIKSLTRLLGVIGWKVKICFEVERKTPESNSCS